MSARATALTLLAQGQDPSIVGTILPSPLREYLFVLFLRRPDELAEFFAAVANVTNKTTIGTPAREDDRLIFLAKHELATVVRESTIRCTTAFDAATQAIFDAELARHVAVVQCVQDNVVARLAEIAARSDPPAENVELLARLRVVQADRMRDVEGLMDGWRGLWADRVGVGEVWVPIVGGRKKKKKKKKGRQEGRVVERIYACAPFEPEDGEGSETGAGVSG